MRKLRPLVISIEGSSRHEQITKMFTTLPSLSAHFEAPTFTPGVPSRELRNRLRLLEYANRAGLLPEIEWEQICKAINEHLVEDGDNDVDKTTLTDLRTVSQESIKGEKHTPIDPFIYLATTSRIDVVEEQQSSTTSDQDVNIKTTPTLGKKKTKKNEYETQSLVPISPNRRGSAEDIALPYSMELWRKAKTLNRDRSVFGCALAHLIAMKTLIGDNYEKSDDLSSHHEAAHFDFILEDNVRAFVGIESSNASCECASRIWDIIETSNNAKDKPHLRYYGYLGSKPNLKWLYSRHIPRKSFPDRTTGEGDSGCAIFPFPTNDDFLLDSIDGRSKSSSTRATNETEASETNDSGELSKGQPHFDTPGGTAIWGMFAYTISPAAYHALIEQLRNDVGMLMWKGKRMRAYQAKAIDKIIPRTVRETFGETAVHLSNKVAFVRAPMLGSLLHKQWEQGFCESTELQHELSNHGEGCNVWNHVWLEEEERFIVDYRKKNGNWIRKEDISEKLSSKSNGTTTTRGRGQSPASFVLLSIISMIFLVNTLASAFKMNPIHTMHQKGTLGSTMKSNAEAVLANGEKRERAMLGNVPIISRTINIAEGMNVTIWELERPSSLIQEWWSLDENERESRVGDPFGVVMWPGSILASKELMKQQENVVNARVLVLGAGTGVEAFAAAMLGASKVIATDINPLSLQLLGYGAQRMEGIGNVVEAVHFDLFSSEPLPPCDILVAADTLYNEHLAKQVGHRLHEAIVRSFDAGDIPTKVLVTDSQQFHGTDFLQEKEMIELNALFQEGGWKPLQWEPEKLKNVRGSGVLIDEDQTYDVDVRAIRWGWDQDQY